LDAAVIATFVRLYCVLVPELPTPVTVTRSPTLKTLFAIYVTDVPDAVAAVTVAVLTLISLLVLLKSKASEIDVSAEDPTLS
jgi:hypothetical protein